MQPTLRPYQRDCIDKLRERVIAGKRRLLLYMPTGGGKTVVAAEIIRLALEKGNPSLFLCHRRELVFQASNKLTDIELPHGIILAGTPRNQDDLVQVASVQTLHSRAAQRKVMAPPPAALVIVDECHHATARTWLEILEMYPDAVVIGLTATPIRRDGNGLGTFFQEIVEAPSVQEMIDLGYLVPPEYYTPVVPDLAGVRITHGDYVGADLEAVMDKPKLVGDIVDHINRLAKDRKILVFASGVAHSLHIAKQLTEAGFKAAHIDAKTPKEERDTIFADFHRGNLQIICNCQIATEGVDIPSVSAIVLAQPTKSLGQYLQRVGRGLRPLDNKKDCLILDHAGCYHEHGPINQNFEWVLSGKREKKGLNGPATIGKPSSITCSNPQCGYVFSKSPVCPRCGTPIPQKQGKDMGFVDELLAKVDSSGKAKKADRLPIDQGAFYRGLLHIALSRGYAKGWAAHTYREKFGAWPKPTFGDKPVYPSPEVLSFVRHKQIRYAKGRERGRAGKERAISFGTSELLEKR